jgi:hypothetical protein
MLRANVNRELHLIIKCCELTAEECCALTVKCCELTDRKTMRADRKMLQVGREMLRAGREMLLAGREMLQRLTPANSRLPNFRYDGGSLIRVADCLTLGKSQNNW